jgi:hypothetical protein
MESRLFLAARQKARIPDTGVSTGCSAAEAASMEKQFRLLSNLQLFACVLGMVAGFVPGVSFTGQFYGLDFMSGGLMEPADSQRARVTGVQSDSPAARSGFRVGDIIDSPRTFHEFDAALDAVQRGEVRRFTVLRGTDELVIEAARTEPELAAIWYADAWYPIAGAIFFGIAVLVFATAPIVPAPWSRSVFVILAGISIAVVFGVVLASSSVFSRLRIYQRWPMGVGDEWYMYQGLIGVAAGVLLSCFASAEVRQRLLG